MKTKFSVKNKLYLLFVLVMILAVSIIGWFGFSHAKKAYIDESYAQQKSDVESLGYGIEGMLSTIPQDLLFNSDFYVLKKYMIWKELKEEYKTQMWKNAYISELKAYLRNKKMFYKARVLNANGLEIVHVTYDKNSNNVIVNSDKEIQDKSKREYYKKAIKLNKGEFYISEMNLNVEHSEIERPFRPVIRYATPIINKNQKTKGLLVLNFDANYILNYIDRKSDTVHQASQKFFLLNKDGYYLYNKDPHKRWGFQLENDVSFIRDYPDIFKKFRNKDQITILQDGIIYTAKKIYPDKKTNPERYWYLVSIVDADVALQALSNFIMYFAILLIGILILGLYFINRYITQVITPLSLVSMQLDALSRGEIKKIDISYNANDEIGKITKSSSILVEAIETTIEQTIAVANGKFSSDIKLLSKNDKLGNALNEMLQRLKEITALAESLADGNYDVKVLPKGSDDKLGIALVNMVEYLTQVTFVAESIAEGQIEVKYKAKGENDRLGIAMLKMISYLKSILEQANAISNNDFSQDIQVKSKNDELGRALSKMTMLLRENYIKNKNEMWFNEGVSQFSDKLTGIDDVEELSKEAITMISRYINAATGVVYKYDGENEKLHLTASYAFRDRKHILNEIKKGEGIIGQVALERSAILLQNVTDTEFDIESGTTISKPKEIYAFALMFEGNLYGVVELATFSHIDELQIEYLNKVAEIFATYLHATHQSEKIKTLLEESQKAYEELQKNSKELQDSNAQLEEQRKQLTLQAQEMKRKNEELEKAQKELNKKAEELTKSSKYKSEFLANMSHELRTPLNSIILLSKLLAKTQNLGDDEKEKAKVIHKAGENLLSLINDILDLSKIESGKMEKHEDTIQTQEIIEELQGLFRPVSEQKSIDFILKDEYRGVFVSDKTKLLQILKNLLSNAFKFTEKGSVELRIVPKEDQLKFIVKDTGIGIAQNKLNDIFEAFQQVDGSISRKYGGTGLGLSISKTFAKLLNGKLHVESKEGEGTLFSISIPLVKSKDSSILPLQNSYEEQKSNNRSTDIVRIDKIDEFDETALEGKNILIVDDDSKNLFILSSLLQNTGAEVLSAMNGQEALDLLMKEKVDIILMDIMMPVMNGLDAIENIRKKRVYDHIPIIVITAGDAQTYKEKSLELGADEFLLKPLDSQLIHTIQRLTK